MRSPVGYFFGAGAAGGAGGGGSLAALSEMYFQTPSFSAATPQ